MAKIFNSLSLFISILHSATGRILCQFQTHRERKAAIRPYRPMCAEKVDLPKSVIDCTHRTPQQEQPLGMLGYMQIA